MFFFSMCKAHCEGRRFLKHSLWCCWGGVTSWESSKSTEASAVITAQYKGSMETRWQLLPARLLEADRRHRSTDSHLLTTHQLKCLEKKKANAFHLSSLLFTVFCLMEPFVPFSSRLCTCSETPPLHSHTLSERCFAALSQGWESELLKEVYMTQRDSHSETGKKTSIWVY